jgi:hypothetical protein
MGVFNVEVCKRLGVDETSLQLLEACSFEREQNTFSSSNCIVVLLTIVLSLKLTNTNG